MRTITTLLLLCCAAVLHAQDITGRWTTMDDKTGKPRAVVEITEKNSKLSGRIVDLHDKSKLDALCDACPDDRHDRPIVGLEIIRDMVRSGKEWSKGTILDAESGKVYDCKLWLEHGRLMVRGYVAFFYRTQTWTRTER